MSFVRVYICTGSSGFLVTKGLEYIFIFFSASFSHMTLTKFSTRPSRNINKKTYAYSSFLLDARKETKNIKENIGKRKSPKVIFIYFPSTRTLSFFFLYKSIHQWPFIFFFFIISYHHSNDGLI